MIRRLEIWTKRQCDGGTPVGPLPDWLNPQTEDVLQGVIWTERFKVEVPRLAYYASQLVVGRILRVLYVDSTFDEHRIVELADSTDAGMLVLTCHGILLELTETEELIAATVAGRVTFAPAITPSTVSALFTTWILPALASTWALGTISATAAVAPTVNAATPMALAIQIVELANLAENAAFELSARRNGTTGYYLDVTIRGASDPVAYIRGGLNLIRLHRTRSRVEQVTRATPIGTDNRGLGDAWFLVTGSVLNTYLAIADIGGSLVNPILDDDQFNGLYLAIEGTSTLYPITDTDRANQRLHMNPTPSSPNGKWVRICQNASGDDVAWLDYPTQQTTYGIVNRVLRPPYPGRTNWAKNGNQLSWSGSRPDDWGGAGTAPTKVTTAGFWETGGWAARYNGVGFASLSSSRSSIRFEAGEVLTVAARARVDATGAHLLRFFNPLTSLNDDVLFDSSWTELGVYGYVVKQYAIATAGLYSFGVSLETGLGGGDTYFDHVLFLKGADLPSGYIHHSGAASLWLSAATRLRTHGDPVSAYDMTVADLYRADPAQFMNAPLNPGCTIDVGEPDLGVAAQARLIGLRTLHDVPLESQMTVATRHPELTDLLVRA